MTFTRRDVWTLTEDDPVVTAYADAVTALRARPASDPTSWAFQAAIHGTASSGRSPLWNQCRHGSWFFLSWHRMYLYYFEQIVRAQVIAQGGPADWALPYWNYDGEGSNSLPLAFRSAASPLFVRRRNPAVNAGALFPKAITSADFAMSRRVHTGASEFGGGIVQPGVLFWSETGRLEQTPHNDIHVAVGGQMGAPDTAALDPIFWLHHANIDRLWAQWQLSHPDPTEAGWLEQTFEFADASGATVSTATSKIVRIADLDYAYDTVPVASEASAGASA